MRYPNRVAAPVDLQTKTELKQARRKLAVGQVPIAEYWQGHTWIAHLRSGGGQPSHTLWIHADPDYLAKQIGWS